MCAKLYSAVNYSFHLMLSFSLGLKTCVHCMCMSFLRALVLLLTFNLIISIFSLISLSNFSLPYADRVVIFPFTKDAAVSFASYLMEI